MTRFTSLLASAIVLLAAPAASAQTRPAIGDPMTTPSGLKYKFTQLGTGPKAETGDLMVIHGIGMFTDSKEFWNTRTDNAPYEYTLGVDRVIKGFEEGMNEVREGDRIVITMTPELAYGERGNPGSNIPPNTTLVFDYEILGVKKLSIARVLREGFAIGTVDETIEKAKALPNLKEHYASVSSVRAAANAANRKQPGDGEKVLALGMTLLPASYELPQALARAQAQRNAVPDAIKNYETALKLNQKKTAVELRDFEAATTALADLRKKSITTAAVPRRESPESPARLRRPVQ